MPKRLSRTVPTTTTWCTTSSIIGREGWRAVILPWCFKRRTCLLVVASHWPIGITNRGLFNRFINSWRSLHRCMIG